MKNKKWWLGVRENGSLEMKYIVSPLRQPWVQARSGSIRKLLEFAELGGWNPLSIKGLPPFAFGKRFGKRR
jgi:hypothetical protein